MDFTIASVGVSVCVVGLGVGVGVSVGVVKDVTLGYRSYGGGLSGISSSNREKGLTGR